MFVRSRFRKSDLQEPEELLESCDRCVRADKNLQVYKEGTGEQSVHHRLKKIFCSLFSSCLLSRSRSTRIWMTPCAKCATVSRDRSSVELRFAFITLNVHVTTDTQIFLTLKYIYISIFWLVFGRGKKTFLSDISQYCISVSNKQNDLICFLRIWETKRFGAPLTAILLKSMVPQNCLVANS